MFAVLVYSDFVVIAAIVLLCGIYSAALAAWMSSSAHRFFHVERKLNLILRHLGIEDLDPRTAAGLSDEVRALADDPKKKIPAIKLHREQTGIGLKEAKEAVEDYMNRAANTPQR